MKPNTANNILLLVVSLAVTVLSLVYLVTHVCVPGLIPGCSAVLMLLFFCNKALVGSRSGLKLLFAVAGVLNLVACVLQVWSAASGIR